MKNENNHDDLGNTRRLRTTSKIHFTPILGTSSSDEDGHKNKTPSTRRTLNEDSTTTATTSCTETKTTRTIDTEATSSTDQEAEEEAAAAEQQQHQRQSSSQRLTIIRSWVRLILVVTIFTGLFATTYISFVYDPEYSSYNKSVSCSVYDCDCDCQKDVIFENRSRCPSDENSIHDHKRTSFFGKIFWSIFAFAGIIIGAFVMSFLVMLCWKWNFSADGGEDSTEDWEDFPVMRVTYWFFFLLCTAHFTPRLFIVVTTFTLWGGGTPRSQHSEVNKDCPLYVYNGGDNSCYKYESFENYQNCPDDSTTIIHKDDVELNDDFMPGSVTFATWFCVLISMIGILLFIHICVINYLKRTTAKDSSEQQQSLPKISTDKAPIVQQSICFGSSSTMTVECLKCWIRLILVITIFTGKFVNSFISLTKNSLEGGDHFSIENSTCSVYDCDCGCVKEVIFENRSKCPSEGVAADGDSFHDEVDTMNTFVSTLFASAGMFVFTFLFVGISLHEALVENAWRPDYEEKNPMILTLRKTILIIWSLLLWLAATYTPRQFITIFTLGVSEDSDHANEDCRYVYNSGDSCYKYEIFENNQNCPDGSRLIRKDDVDLIDSSISTSGSAFESYVIALFSTIFITGIILAIICWFQYVFKKLKNKLVARASNRSGYMTTNTQIV